MIENASGIEHNPQSRSGERGLYLYHCDIWTSDDGQTKSLDPQNNYYVIDNNYTVGIESGDGYAVGATSGTITIGNKGQGIYHVAYNGAFSVNKGCNIHADVFVDGVEMSKIGFTRDIANANDHGSASMQGLLFLEAGAVVDVRYSSDTANTTVDIDHANLSIVRIGNQAVTP